MDIDLGQIVKSKAGRDEGKSFIVVQIVDKDFIMLSDGSLRKIEKPKKKRTKHIKPSEIVIESIRDKLKNGLKVTNSEIRKILSSIEIDESNKNISNEKMV